MLIDVSDVSLQIKRIGDKEEGEVMQGATGFVLKNACVGLAHDRHISREKCNILYFDLVTICAYCAPLSLTCLHQLNSKATVCYFPNSMLRQHFEGNNYIR